MNPIEFLKQNGYNPDNFRTDVNRSSLPQFAPKNYNPCRKVRVLPIIVKETIRRRSHISDIRKNIYDEWFEKKNQQVIGIFIPHLLLDVFQIVSNEHLSKVDFRNEERRHYTHLMNDYHRFNSLFFQELTPKRQDIVIQMFDDFGEYIHNEVEIFRFSIINSVMELNSGYRETCADLCISVFMIRQAVMAWTTTYRNNFRNDENTMQILKSMDYHISELMRHYFARENKLKQNVYLATIDTVQQAEKNIGKKINQFLIEYEIAE